MGFIFSMANITSAAAGEQPDALGVNSAGITFLVESKISRSDFHADKRKPWRQEGHLGLGHHRAYVTPKGLLKPEEVPYGWQLWEVHGKNKPIIKVIKGKIKAKNTDDITKHWSGYQYPHTSNEEMNYFSDKASDRSALGLLATILSRIDHGGVDLKLFASRHGKGFLKR